MASKFGDILDNTSRFSDCTSDPQEIFPPIQGFEDRPLVTLEEAVKPLTSLVEQVNHMVWTVKKKCSHPKDGLSHDESASIMLYTLEWTPAEKSFYFILNATFRSQNRRELIPWFLYLRLFICALSKLPPSLPRVIYRGVKMDLSNDYSEGNEFIWWSFSSCTSSIGVLENHIGKTGKRTIFNVVLHSAKDISQHSFFETEREYLLYPARQFKVNSTLNTGNELHIIELEETQPPFRLIPIPETPLSVSAEKPKPSILSVNTSSNASSKPNKNTQLTAIISSSSSENEIINILLLGERSVGKSTFINAFVNYLTFETLQEAESNKPVVLIPVSFLITAGDNFDEHIIKFGDFDKTNNEDFDHPGQSVTQRCKSYVFDLEHTNGKKLRIIDTPGLVTHVVLIKMISIWSTFYNTSITSRT